MQQSDTPSAYYQAYQPHFQNPIPSPPTSADSHLNPTPSVPSATFASAPPLTSGYSPSNFSNYPPYSSNSDQFAAAYPPSSNLNPNSVAQQPSPLPYSFPHLESSYSPYDSNQGAALNYYHSNSNIGYDSSYLYSSGASGVSPSVNHYNDSFGHNANFGGFGDQSAYDSGVYKYSGGKSEASSGGTVLFDDYGRPVGASCGNEKIVPRIVKAAPKVEEPQDVKGGVQKFRVKILSEGLCQSDMDVLCQIGLDGIRILEPATSRTLKIYPLETVTRCEVLDSYIFAFWTKTNVDIEPRRVRLKSNSYTTSNILDTVTAASIQVKEMGDTKSPSDSIKGVEQSAEKKKGLIDWKNFVKQGNEEKDHWVPDEAVTKCTSCATAFNAFVRRHHCRNCGDIFCDKCTQGRIALTADEQAQPVRVCDQCMAEVTQRLSNTKEAAIPGGIHSHEDRVRKLKEEMEKNRKSPTGLTSEGSGKLIREVACPTCTVHLQVEVPATGSETIECSVCQHPFRVGS